MKSKVYCLLYWLVAFAICTGGELARGASPDAAYTITALDILPGGLDSAAFGLSESGRVVGHSALNRTGNVGQSRPVSWNEAGGPSELWTANGPNSWGGIALGINNDGQVVGRYGAGSGVPLPSLTIRPGAAFIWDPVQGMRDLGSLGGLNAEAVGINETGQVVGTSETPTGGRAFIWDAAGGMRNLGSLGGTWSFGRDINNVGQVVGTSWGANNFGERAFIWDSVSGMRDLGSPTGGSTRAFAINDLGHTVGVDYGMATGQGGIAGMVVWGEETLLVPQPTGGRPSPHDINNHGQIVGSFGVNETNAFVWHAGTGFVDLEGLIPLDSGWDLEEAFAINDAGQIVGFGRLNGGYRAFVMTPVPEPSTLALSFIAALAIVVLISRRVNVRKYGS